MSQKPLPPFDTMASSVEFINGAAVLRYGPGPTQWLAMPIGRYELGVRLGKCVSMAEYDHYLTVNENYVKINTVNLGFTYVDDLDAFKQKYLPDKNTRLWNPPLRFPCWFKLVSTLEDKHILGKMDVMYYLYDEDVSKLNKGE